MRVSRMFFFQDSTCLERTASLELTSCESGAHLSQLEVEAFKALEEMIRFVKTVNFSEVLARTPELIFLNLVTLEGTLAALNELCAY